jgi:hypothetical protein
MVLKVIGIVIDSQPGAGAAQAWPKRIARICKEKGLTFELNGRPCE